MSDPRLLNQFFSQAMAVRQACPEGLPEELRAGVWPYEEDQLLEEGGMKRIFRCRDRRSGRLVARAEMRHPEKDGERFLREARITAYLQHPAIMPVYEIGAKPEGSPYFTMKLVEGRDLGAVLELLRQGDPQAGRDFPLEVRINIFCRICEAMAYAHQHGIIHLDLKPANIEVSAHGEVLVCDWGLARILDEVCEDPVLLEHSLDSQELNSLTRDGYIKGSPGYMSPEQAGGPFTRKDQRSDIFSLGAILYSLLTFEMPFRGDSVDDLVEATRLGRIEPLDKHRQTHKIPPGLEAICLKALALDPSRRYVSVLKLQRELNAYLNGFAPQAETASFTRQLLLLIRRNRLTCAALAVSGLGFFILSLLFLGHVQDSRRQRQHDLLALKEEQVRSAILGREAAPSFLAKALKAEEAEDFDRALELAKTAIKLDPQLNRCYGILGHGYFIRGEFAASADAYRRYDTRNPSFAQMLEIAEYGRDLARPGQELTVEQLLSVMEKTKVRHWVILNRLIERLVLKPIKIEDRLALVRGTIKLMNSPEHDPEITFDGRHLDLSGSPRLYWALILQAFPAQSLTLVDSNIPLEHLRDMPLEELSMIRCKVSDFSPLLNCRSLNSLSLQECEIADLGPLQELGIKTLDLRHSEFKNLNLLTQFRHLKRVIFSPGQFEPSAFPSLLPGVKVEFRE
ncbi:MAG: hypothetical protein RL095_1890 [Verrucomicrobiota bacterium]|jgi:serine/threonine protein kinase